MTLSAPTLQTQRLRLRPWREADKAPFAALNADPAVMEHFPATLSREQSDVQADALQRRIVERGFGFWAVEAHGVAPFIGFVGISIPSFDAHFTPCIEVGWRLARAHWGKGYATEAAREALRFGFEDLDLAEIVAFTVPANERSRAVMERLGMTRKPQEDFDHPNLAAGHPLQRHVLYRLGRADWRNARSAG